MVFMVYVLCLYLKKVCSSLDIQTIVYMQCAFIVGYHKIQGKMTNQHAWRYVHISHTNTISYTHLYYTHCTLLFITHIHIYVNVKHIYIIRHVTHVPGQVTMYIPIPLGLRSSSTMWLSVPSLTIECPSFCNSSPRALALAST
jgi:hypothetical protein